MKHVTWAAVLSISLVCAKSAIAQDSIPQFNKTDDHQIGLGFSITSFSSNFAYFVSPFYAYRHARHWIAFSPFYGRLDALPKQQNIGVGLEYRIYPFKNLSRIRYYAPAGIHYTYSWLGNRKKHSLFYTIGVGSDTDLGKHFRLSVDVKFGLGQNVSGSKKAEEQVFGTSTQPDYYFLPTIRIGYIF